MPLTNSDALTAAITEWQAQVRASGGVPTYDPTAPGQLAARYLDSSSGSYYYESPPPAVAQAQAVLISEDRAAIDAGDHAAEIAVSAVLDWLKSLPVAITTEAGNVLAAAASGVSTAAGNLLGIPIPLLLIGGLVWLGYLSYTGRLGRVLDGR
jgi:hypothetical protein